MIHRFFHLRRVGLIDRSIGSKPALDMGSGKSPKGDLTLDISHEHNPNIVADIRYLPLRDHIMHSIVCSHVVEHIANPADAFSEVCRVLTPKGKAIFFLPDDGSPLWRVIRPFWSLYYEQFVDKNSSPATHEVILDYPKFLSILKTFFRVSRSGKLNFGSEIYAVGSPVNGNA